jgi:CotS family spore coat protein
VVDVAELDPRRVIEAYGADPEVLEEYDCVPLEARVVRDVLKLRTESGWRALKRVVVRAVRLDAAFRCAEHVAKSGFANVPRFIRTRYGDPYVRHATGQYYLTRWWPGKELDVSNKEELCAGLRVLGQWHQAARGAVPADSARPAPPSFEERLQTLHSELVRYRQVAEAEHAATPFERRFAASADELQVRVESALERLADMGFAQAQREWAANGWVCHGDFTSRNLTVDGATYTVWNYERVHPGLPALEVALYLHRYMPAFEWAADVLADAVQQYRESAGSAADPAWLAVLLSVPLRSLQLVSRYYQKSGQWTEQEFVNAFEASLDLDQRRTAACAEVFDVSEEVHVPVAGRSEGAKGEPTVDRDSGHTPPEHDIDGTAQQRQEPLALTLTTGAAASKSVADATMAHEGDGGAAAPTRQKRERSKSRTGAKQRSQTKRAARGERSARPNTRKSHSTGAEQPKVWGSVTPTDRPE